MRRGEQHARQGIIAAFKERNIGWTNFDMVRRTDNIYYPRGSQSTPAPFEQSHEARNPKMR